MPKTDAKELRFGVEIETVGRGREALASAVASVVGGLPSSAPGGRWTVAMADGRTWTVVPDGSLSSGLSGEIVSPILTDADIPTLQEIVRAVRRTGATVDDSCGLHVHVDAILFDAKALCRLMKTVNKNEDLIHAALGFSASRGQAYCRRVDQTVLANVERRRPSSLRALNEIWYGGYYNGYPDHYDSTRYHGLNLHNVWYLARNGGDGTIEFRWFTGTLHAGKVKAYVQFCRALAAKALNSRAASSQRRSFDPFTSRYDFRVFLLNLGLIGPEYKTARKHLLERLAGDAAFRHGRTPTTAAAA